MPHIPAALLDMDKTLVHLSELVTDPKIWVQTPPFRPGSVQHQRKSVVQSKNTACQNNGAPTESGRNLAVGRKNENN